MDINVKDLVNSKELKRLHKKIKKNTATPKEKRKYSRALRREAEFQKNQKIIDDLMNI